MKIESPLSPPSSRASSSVRKATADAPVAPDQTRAARPASTRDSIQISDQAVALRSTAEANRLAAETRELISQGNREAVLAQPVDVGRLQELLRTAKAPPPKLS